MSKHPYPFILEELAAVKPYTKPMFGALGVYVGEAIVLILRQKEGDADNNGVWIATTEDRHEALRKDLPSMRSIPMFGPGVTGWQLLSESDPRFEEDVFKACERVRKLDPRIGKIPAKKKPRKKGEALGGKTKKAKASKGKRSAGKKKK